MDMHKLTHEICEAARHWHLPLFAGLIASVWAAPKKDKQENISDLGEVPGDNILPSEILFSLSSRRVL